MGIIYSNFSICNIYSLNMYCVHANFATDDQSLIKTKFISLIMNITTKLLLTSHIIHTETVRCIEINIMRRVKE